MSDTPAAPVVGKIYACIAAVSAELAQSGIGKTRNNQQQGYKFRGIDDVYNALAPIISKHGLVIVPYIKSRTVTERTTQKGGVLFNVVVDAEFNFCAAEDGSRVTVRMFGEAMDSADKATNKAMSAAYKYAAMQTFCIPTEGDNDADATTLDVRAQSRVVDMTTGEERPALVNELPPPPDPPDGFPAWWATLPGVADEGIEKLAAAWEAVPKSYRVYVAKYEADAWAALKRRAEAVKVPA